jgi:hypothetical protein
LIFALSVTIEGLISLPTSPTGRYQVTGTSFHCIIIDTTTREAWPAHLPEHSGSGRGRFAAPKNENK